MNVRCASTACLPNGVGAVLVEGDQEAVLLLSECAPVSQIAEEISDILNPWCSTSWVHVDTVLRSMTG